LLNTLPNQRLAAGPTNAAGAAGDEKAAQALQLLNGQQFGTRQKGLLLFHAINAAQVAAIRDRYAPVIDRAAKGIDQLCGVSCAISGTSLFQARESARILVFPKARQFHFTLFRR
jgi:hypothetical protein